LLRERYASATIQSKPTKCLSATEK
jgi:hypothetical protein